jgi:hypothetical protein
MKSSHRMHSVTLQKRLSALEAVVEQHVEERIEERVEEEIINLLSLLEQHLSREEFLKVAHIAAWGPSEAGDEGEGVRSY